VSDVFDYGCTEGWRVWLVTPDRGLNGIFMTASACCYIYR